MIGVQASSPGIQMIPAIKRFTPMAGRLQAHQGIILTDKSGDPRIARATESWRQSLPRAKPGCELNMQIRVDASACLGPQAYWLRIEPESVSIIGGGADGCYYALRTLSMMTSCQSDLVCGEIEDWPDLQVRGVLHDVSRGKVPTLQTLKYLVDRLSALKVNQLQLYIEHAFTFSFDASICDSDHGLTQDEIAELDAYAHERFVSLVPAIANLGHMSRILTLDQYRHLAEIPAPASWANLNWPQRARGFTLDCMNPESWQLVERIMHDILPCFSSEVVNICGDEPWDLCRGKNNSHVSEAQRGSAYVEHICRTHELAKQFGKRTYAWADVLAARDELLSRLPSDLEILHWGYDDATDYEKTGRFTEMGFKTHVCPGVSGWKRILNDVAVAEKNISRFASAATNFKATGLLNTDWGDHGHFNALACSWLGFAQGAAAGWNTSHIAGESLCHDLAESRLFGVTKKQWLNVREAALSVSGFETWRTLWMPANEVANEESLPTTDQVALIAESADKAFESLSTANDQDAVELANACKFLCLWAHRMAHLGLVSDDCLGTTSISPKEWVESWDRATTSYLGSWKVRYKSGGFDDIESALTSTRQEFIEFTSA